MSNDKKDSKQDRRATLEQLLEAYMAITGNPATEVILSVEGDGWHTKLGDFTNEAGTTTPTSSGKELLKALIERVTEQADNLRKQVKESEDRLRAMGHNRPRRKRAAKA